MMIGRSALIAMGSGLLWVGCASDPAADEVTASPLADAIGYDPMTSSWPERDLAEREASCLNERGFAVPVDLEPGESRDAGEGAGAEQGQVAALISRDPDFSGDVQTPYASFQQTLAGAELDSFNRALNDCNEIALDAVYGTGRSDHTGLPPIVDRAVEEMRSRVRSDPRTVSAFAAYAECMQGEGFADYDDPNLVAERLNEMYDGLVQLVNAEPNVDATDERVVEMQNFERSIQSATNRCTVQADVDATLDEVTTDVQRAYLEQHPEFSDDVTDLQRPSP